MDYDLLITDATILPLANDGLERIDRGYLAIKGERIAALGPMRELPAAGKALITIDGSDSIVMPGLINTHCHAAMTLFRGLADDLPLMEWLNNHIFPAEARFVNAEMVYWCTRLAAAEMLRSGTTCVADGYFHEDAAASAFCETGIRAVAAQGVVDFPAPGVPDPAGNIAAVEQFLDTWQGREPLLTPAIFCHAPYTCSPETLQRGKELARQRGVPFFIHLAETEFEVQESLKKHGVTPTRHLYRLGVLDPNTVAVHCVWLNADDQRLLAETGTRVASCPGSNMKLAAGIAPLAELRRNGVVIGLGTDGCASNNNLDLFEEMDLAGKLQKVKHLDPTLLPARAVLGMATVGGAEALGLGEQIGSLVPGKKADCILLDRKQANLLPLYGAELLTSAATGGDVRTVIVNGRVVMRDRRMMLFDETETMAHVRELAKKVTAPT
ncbi:MAG: amidohydrolase [Desulfobulbaceae bacterium]|nr:amidohydrolase [Desulfobulbaceae bacterium]